MGWPACGKTMVHWFSTNERGTVVSVWNTAHNVGGALVANLAGLGVCSSATGARRSTSTRRSRRASRFSAGPADARHAAVLRAAADRAAPERLSSELQRGARTEFHVPPDFHGARAEQQVPLGDRGCERLRLLRALRRRELDPDLPADPQGTSRSSSRAIGWSLYEIRGHSRHHHLRVGVGQGLQEPPRAGHDPVHGADAGGRRRLLAEHQRAALDRLRGARRRSGS